LPADDVRGKVVDVRSRNDVAIQAIVEASQSPQVFVTDAVFEDVSATAIRAAAKNGQAELTTMVPREVAHYIEKYKLYKN